MYIFYADSMVPGVARADTLFAYTPATTADRYAPQGTVPSLAEDAFLYAGRILWRYSPRPGELCMTDAPFARLAATCAARCRVQPRPL